VFRKESGCQVDSYAYSDPINDYSANVKSAIGGDTIYGLKSLSPVPLSWTVQGPQRRLLREMRQKSTFEQLRYGQPVFWASQMNLFFSLI
jgi:hypothetical protein